MLSDWQKKGSAATQAHAVMASKSAVDVIASTSDLNEMNKGLEQIRVYLNFARLPNCDFTTDTVQALEACEAKALQVIRYTRMKTGDR